MAPWRLATWEGVGGEHTYLYGVGVEGGRTFNFRVTSEVRKFGEEKTSKFDSNFL